VFRSVSFEQSCAECHSEPLKSAGIEGLVVLQVPSLDRAKLEKNGHNIGPWPESASLMMDGELSPLLLHMLRLSETGRSILERLPKSGGLKDVNLDDPSQAAAITELAAFVRETWGQLASNGQPMLKRWFETDSISRTNSISNARSPQLELYARFVSARSTNDPETTLPSATTNESHNEKKELWANQLAMGVPPDLLRSASSKWFHEAPPQPTPVGQSDPLSQSAPHSQSVDADRLPVVMSIDPSRATPVDKITQPKPLARNDQNRQALSPSVNPISVRFEPIVASKSLQDDDDLLTDSQEDLLTAPSNNPLSTIGKNDPLAEQDDLLTGSDNSALVLDDLKTPNPTTTEKPLKPWEHLPYGGWMIDDNRVALVYVPTGHADPWVSRWIEWNLLLRQDYGPMEFQDGFLKQCVQCHSFDSQRIKQMLYHDTTPNVNSLTANKTIPVHHASTEDIDGYCWKIEQRPNALREITKFNHTPHLSINSLRDCQSCHTMKKLNEQQTAEQGWSDRGRTTRSEFLPIQKNQCASCHTARSAGDACTQCHNYHVHGLFRDH
jgi:hypothetical protein